MTSKTMRSLICALVVCTAAVAAAFAQGSTSSNQPVSLSGTYQLDRVNVGDVSVSMTFTAKITNTGGTDVSGPIVLRHPNDIMKIYERFGEKSIAAGKSVTVSDTVTVPREIYDGWISGAGPAVFFNTKNERGDIKTYRISLQATKAVAAAE